MGKQYRRATVSFVPSDEVFHALQRIPSGERSRWINEQLILSLGRLPVDRMFDYEKVKEQTRKIDAIFDVTEETLFDLRLEREFLKYGTLTGRTDV